MKRKLMVLMVLVMLTALLCGCGAGGGSVRFTGVVEEIHDNAILVSTTDDVGFTQAMVDISDVETPSLVIGGALQITIDPLIAETFPVQVTALKVKTAQ